MQATTIYALSSGHGTAGVAVLRVSGPETRHVIELLSPKRGIPLPRLADLRWFYHPVTGEPLDQGLLLWFPAPGSFTGEDVAEFQIHGGRAVIAAFLAALGECPGLRIAEEGEFTRRAYDSGRLDLTAVEGLADLIHAETEKQREVAIRQMGGGLTNLYEGWRQSLLTALAFTEADIDFADEEVPDDVYERVRPVITSLRDDMLMHLNDNRQGERLRDGLFVVILGVPNAGKSSLLNALSQRDVAIVSDIAGTTRDNLEVHLDIDGYAVTLVDTAGLRETSDVIEHEGVRRSLSRAANADIKLLLCDGRTWPAMDDVTKSLCDEKTIFVVNKIDLAKDDFISFNNKTEDGHKVCFISVVTGEGLDVFIDLLKAEVANLFEGREMPLITRHRHRQYVQEALNYIEAFISDSGKDIELAAEDLRMAARSLSRLMGLLDVEDILGKIFSEFCIGK